MPVHNAERFLQEAILSLQAQTMTHWELVAVLDRCTDASRQLLSEADDERIRVLDAPSPGGLVTALNFGLRECRAEAVARLDADDVCDPFRLGIQLRALEARPRLGVLGSAAITIDEASRTTGLRRVPCGTKKVQRRLLWRNALIHPSVMFRRSLILGLGGYDPSCARFEDYDLWLRTAGVADVDNLTIPLLRYRVHQGQTSRRFAMSEVNLGVLYQSRLVAARRIGVPTVGVATRHAAWVLGQRRGRARRWTQQLDFWHRS
jgi:hypothetical protein